MTSDTFTITRVRDKSGTTDGTSYTTLDDKSYGGLTFGFSGLGKAAPFRVVLPNYDGSLNDAASARTGLKFKTRDEITIQGTTTSVYRGIVTQIEVPVFPQNERVVILSGIDWYNYWAPKRKREVDYRLNPLKADQVVKDALADVHPDIDTTSSSINAFTTLVEKNWVACSCRDIVQECCQAVGAEFNVNGSKTPLMFAVGSLTLGQTITESMLANATGSLIYNADDAEYDEINVVSNNPVFAPNAVSPTGFSYAGSPNWWQTSQTPTDLGVVAGHALETTTKASAGTTTLIGGTYPAMIASSTASSLALAIRPPFTATDIFSSVTTAGKLQLVEADWDHLNFAVMFDFNNLTSLKIRLSEATGPGQGSSSSYWESPELLPVPTAATQPTLFRLALPSVVAADPSSYSWSWTQVGLPVNIDMVFFYFSGTGALSNNFDKKCYVSYVYFDSMGQKTATVGSPPTPKAQKILVDRTLTQENDIQNLVTNELTRLQNNAFTGQLTLEGTAAFDSPGFNATLSFPALNPNNITARIDYVQHKVMDGEWTTTIDFAPTLLSSPIFNRLGQIALRRNEESDQDFNNFAFGEDNAA